MKREYFYTDSKGKIRRNHYCSECGKQYNDDEFKAGLILSKGLENAPMKYCATPCFELKFPPHPVKITEPIPKKETSQKPVQKKK